MKHSLLIKLVLVSILLSFISFNVNAQEKEILLGGKVLNSESQDEIPFAHILINDTRFGVVADEWGGYRVLVHAGDSLTIKAVGFKDAVLVIPSHDKEDMYKNILLEPTTYMLADVDVYTLGTWEQFKQDFIHMKVEESESKKLTRELNMNIASAIKAQVSVADCQYASMLRNEQAGAVSTCGISTGSFSFGKSKAKRTKERRENLKARTKRHRIIARKYNSEIVAEIIGEHEAKRLEHFMAYVNTHSTITEKTTQLQVINIVKRLYSNYILLFPEENKTKRDTTV